MKNLNEVIAGAHFSITSDFARKRSKKFYEEVIKIIEGNLADSWAVERIIPYIFNLKYEELDSLK
jgi:hypothetical protein